MNRLQALPYFLVFTFPALLYVGVMLGGGWTFLATVFVFGFIPIADALVGVETRAPGPEQRRLHDLPLFLWVPTQIIVIGWALHTVVQGNLSPLEIVGLLLSTGLVAGGGGITIAHELMHRREAIHRAGAEVLMLSVGYPHFCVEHVHGHHRHVGTPQDPATARRGESLWRFLPRSVFGGVLSFLRIEDELCRRRGLRGLSLRDRRNRYPLALGIVHVGVALWLGPLGNLALLGVCVVAVVLLEAINYIEHYGLRRRELSPGRFERVQPRHSWNSAHRVSNWYLFNLARHADHHFEAKRPYDRLRNLEDAPQLPQGYATMLLAATIPPLWFRLMDPHLPGDGSVTQKREPL